MAVLDPDAAGQADLGHPIGLLPPVVGRDAVARGALRFLGPGSGTTLVTVPAGVEPTVVALRGGEAVVLVTLTIRDGVVDHIHAIADPAQLAPVTAALRV